ncbi:MAG TPA: hypothetical protein VFE36_07600 [Candidatus Baltobacteraceae bacterium]|jgi:hypothetical protein|nr:hypothetical protein [Candidatus Baltobacteraceae bacterium]
MMHFRRFTGIGALVILAACAQAGSPVTPNSATSAGIRSALPGYRVVSYTYRIMPLRTSSRTRRSNADGLIYPDDLTNYGGPMMKSAAAHNIYVNCPAKNQSCWGAPEAFQAGLRGSSFAGMLKQYTGSGPNAYAFSDSVPVSFTVFKGTALYENDLFGIIHQVAAKLKKTGYADIYHVFLPKGTDTCFDFSKQCYSPDHNPTFWFCAYHGTVKFSDLGLVIYSIEPYQDISFCATKKSSGASEVTNSTISTLAHETFEAITDPGPKLAWYNDVGGEVADECEYFVSKVKIGGILYNSQPMYSNRYHACATVP